MLSGEYKFYLDGDLVVASGNIITNFGKLAIMRYLAGNITSYAGAIAVGVSPKTTNTTDFVLDYELFRVPIAYKTTNMANSSIVFKATAGSGVSGIIHEVGMFPSQNNELSGAYQTASVFNMNNDEAWQGVIARDTVNSRIGSSAITLTAAGASMSSIYNQDVRLDLSGYSATDVFKLAFITFDNNATSIAVKFTNGDGAEIMGIFAPEAHTSGASPQYQIISITKSQFSNQNANWANIIRADVMLYAGAGASTVAVDGLKVIDADHLNPEYGLVSRSTLASPVSKNSNQTLDVEYSLVVPL